MTTADKTHDDVQVPMDSAEHLLNFIVHNTDLYMRTKRNETPAEHNKRWHNAFKALQPFLAAMKQKVRDECAKLIERECERMRMEQVAVSEVSDSATITVGEARRALRKALTLAAITVREGK